MSYKKIIKKQQGFTMLELMIASAVFSVVLMLCSLALIQIGRAYYKGVTSIRAQDATRRIIDDISQSIQFSDTTITETSLVTDKAQAFCIGTKRYSYILNKQLSDNPTPTQSKHVLVSDVLPTCNASDVQDLNGTLSSGSREWLEPSMRLLNLEVSKGSSNTVYKIKVRLAYGDDDLFDDKDLTNVICNSGAGSQFCAVSELTTYVRRRL